MKIQLIRHATFILNIDNLKILVDPMLSSARVMGAVLNAANQKSNPLVDLPLSVEEIIQDVNAIIVTHSHRDHLDEKAIEVLSKDLPVFCQPTDLEHLILKGFKDVRPVEEECRWEKIRIVRTDGRHGSGEIEEKMGPVSGFVIQTEGQPITYIVGDSIWCPEVEKALKTFEPQVIISFAGAAQFLTGGAITMNENDIKMVCQSAPDSLVLVGHMEAWNHCMLTRQQLKTFIELNGLENRVIIPRDGECVEFS